MQEEPAKEITAGAPEKPERPRIRPAHIAIAAIILVIGALALFGKTDAPTGMVLESAAPALTAEQTAEFNNIVAECNRYIAERDNNKTLDCLKRADSIKSDLNVISALADLYSITGDSVEAVGYYIRATKISPDDARIRYNYAIALENANLTDDALAQYAKANNTAAMNNIGILLQKLRRFNESRAEFNRALNLEPNNTVILTNSANLLAQMGLNADAEESFRRAILLSPKDKSIYRNFAQFLYNNGRYAEAKDALEKSY